MAHDKKRDKKRSETAEAARWSEIQHTKEREMKLRGKAEVEGQAPVSVYVQGSTCGVRRPAELVT